MHEIPAETINHPNAIFCRITWSTLIACLNLQELKDLAPAHGLQRDRMNRQDMENLFHSHVCTELCTSDIAMIFVRNEVFDGDFEHLDIESAGFLGPYLNTEPDCQGFKLQCGAHCDDGMLIIPNFPIHQLTKYLTIPGLRCLATVHGIRTTTRPAKLSLVKKLNSHSCASCPILHYKFRPIIRNPGPQKATKPVVSVIPFSWDPYKPPDIADIMSAYCKDLSPNAVEETGCAAHSMTPISALEHNLDVLIEPGATPVNNFDGPVLAPRLAGVCSSLANWLWLGEIPEQVLISRVRHNYCVVRVSNGHAKMIANAIAFEQPSWKIYNTLPIALSELDDVLSVVFTGKVRPSPEDLRRTPVLVRRKRVQAALEWLRLNHKDYYDLTIDHAVLNTYPLDDTNVDDEGNVLDATKSVFDSIEEVGTSSGPCPFTVHGLSADVMSEMTTTQRKATALQHMINGGSSLAIGHAEDVQSIYNNPSLYPQMFPWLFPYGYGGIVFCIVAFNHMSIKQSSSGSYIMVKRKNFQAIASSITELDATDLTVISERLRDPKAKKCPENAGEQGWFRILDQIEYVGSHVGGSLAARKYQRNEVWSLISFQGTPNWFVTISPVDSKHPLCIYFADQDLEFKPDLRSSSDRLLLVTRNPVASHLWLE
ncbi:hypothetical protein BJ165DRAFT_1414089 [Panaeolus papilionaceus]|nr:hypothetical protein BJ165DRAFT_1414089 [Panaeolus papilionaceus]